MHVRVIQFALALTVASATPPRVRRAGGARAAPTPAPAVSTDAPVPCCPPFGPTPPPPFPAKYETRFFTQPRDHFNYFAPQVDALAPAAPPTFEQRFLYDARHWAGSPAPIIFVTCVEAGPAPYYYGEYGWVVDTLASNLSALVVFAEHRGFGLTYPAVAPGGDLAGWAPDAAHAGVLTEAQVLEDFTALATALRTNLSAWDSPLIAVGGSLAGEMAAWWRIRYPFMVDMALSASAPIFGFPGEASNRAPLCDQFGWEKVVTNAFRAVGGDACVDAFRTGHAATAALAPAALTAAFNTCTPATRACHAAQIADMALYWTETAAELGSYPASNPARSQTAWACAQMAGKAGVAAFAALMAPQAPGQCLNVTWDACGAAVAAGAPAVPGYCATRWSDPSSGCQDGWGVESCTTEIHPIQANGVTDFFPPTGPFNLTDRVVGCRAQFGSDLRVDGRAMPRSFGQLDAARMAASATRIIFSSGEFDPWKSMSINATLAPALPFVFIKGGAHHSDIGNNWNPMPTDDDEPALRAARAAETAILKGWVAEFGAERRAAKARVAAAGWA